MSGDPPPSRRGGSEGSVGDRDAVFLLPDHDRGKFCLASFLRCCLYYFIFLTVGFCLQLIYTMSELEAGYRRFEDARAAWKDKAVTAEAEKAVLVEQLKLSTDRVARLEDEISRLTDALAALVGWPVN